ncbi:MAG: hypothetical protein WD851_11380 [Pirellulales bacterium]
MRELSPARGAAFVGIMFIGLLTGCNSHEAQVYGTVSFNGETLDKGTVRFEPTAGGAPAYSQVESDGSYELRTGREVGLQAGEYQATVVALEEADPNWAGPGPPPPGKPITPRWYQNLQTSGLKYTVEPGGNEIDIDLSTTPPAGWREPGTPRRS